MVLFKDIRYALLRKRSLLKYSEVSKNRRNKARKLRKGGKWHRREAHHMYSVLETKLKISFSRKSKWLSQTLLRHKEDKD